MPPGLYATLAWRNLWRHPRRSVIMLVAIALAVWSMVTLGALSRGVMEQQMRSAIRTLTGHIQIHAQAYRDDPVIENSMPPPAPPLAALLRQAEVKGWAARVRVPAVVASERESIGVILVGIDPGQERGLSFIADALVRGRPLASVADMGVVLGRKLVERLETAVGKRVVLMSQDRNNDIADRGFRVVGVFAAEAQATETAYVFVGRATAQSMLKLGDRISEIALIGQDRERLDPLLSRLRAAAPTLDIQPWTELEPLLVLTVETFEVFMYIWFVVVFLAMSFGLVNTLLMAVFERTREIGLLQALGMRPRWILVQVLLESLLLLALGLGLGNVLAWASIAWLHDGIDVSRFEAGLELFKMGKVMYPAVVAKDVAAANLVVFVLGLVASLYPAWRAARYVPVQAITRP